MSKRKHVPSRPPAKRTIPASVRRKVRSDYKVALTALQELGERIYTPALITALAAAFAQQAVMADHGIVIAEAEGELIDFEDRLADHVANIRSFYAQMSKAADEFDAQLRRRQ